MRDLLEQKLARYEQLEADLMNPEVLSNPARITSVAREHGSLGKLAKKYRKFKQFNGQMAEAQQMIDGDDAEMRELADFKEMVMAIEGEGSYRELQYESGGHRVQRVPDTETQGRIHTSAATVAVLPEPEEVEVDLKTADYRLDTFC